MQHARDKNSYNDSVDEPKGKQPLVRPRGKREGHIEIDTQ
jgi:hypothetical protein